MHSFVRAFVVRCLAGMSLCLLSISAVNAGSGAGSKAQIVINPGFESPYIPVLPSTGKSQISGSIAQGWRDNSSWANVTVVYGEETVDIKAGHSAQSVMVKAVREGGVQFIQPFQVENNHTYVASLWVKGLPGAQVSAAIRQNGAPFTTYGDQLIVLNGKWQQMRFQATANAKTDGFFIIYPPTGSKILLDEAYIRDTNATLNEAAKTR